MSVRAPFNPKYGAGQIVTPAAASAVASVPKGNKNLCLTNQGAAVCYVRSGPAAGLAATVKDYAVPPNSQVVITRFEDDDGLAHISAAGTTLHIMPGEGW